VLAGDTACIPKTGGRAILITANMQSETGFPSSHQLTSYVAFKSRLKLAARAVLSADAGLLAKSNSEGRIKIH